MLFHRHARNQRLRRRACAAEHDANAALFPLGGGQFLIPVREHKPLGGSGLRRGDNLLHVPFLDDGAVIEDCNTRTDLLNDAHLVRDQDDRDMQT